MMRNYMRLRHRIIFYIGLALFTLGAYLLPISWVRNVVLAGIWDYVPFGILSYLIFLVVARIFPPKPRVLGISIEPIGVVILVIGVSLFFFGIWSHAHYFAEYGVCFALLGAEYHANRNELLGIPYED